MGVFVVFVGSFLLTVVIVMPVVILSYYLIEKPRIKLGKRVDTWLEAWFARVAWRPSHSA